MKNYQRVFHTKGICYVVMSMIGVIIGMAFLISLASCTHEAVHEHDWGEGKITRAATCTEAGEKTYTCACGETKVEEIPALGHDYSEEWTIDAAATCTTDGSKSHHCSRCDASADETAIPAGHTWIVDEVIEEPSFMHDGEYVYSCSVCGETKQEAVSRGAGTEDDPYLITNEAEWNAFADYTVSNKCIGLYFKLTDDISVTRMASAYISDTTMPFRGKFDGDGHTITLSLDSAVLAGGGNEWNDGLALFMSIGDGCEIRNLTVAGTINTSRKFAAGISTRVVDGAEVIMENCRSSVTINSTVSGDATTAGFYAVGRKNGVDVTFKNCLFDGNFISESGINFSGFVGFQHDDGGATLSFSGCAVVLGEETSERLKTEPGCHTFCRTDPAVEINTLRTLHTTVLGNADMGIPACSDQAEAASGAVENDIVYSETICGKTLYFACLDHSLGHTWNRKVTTEATCTEPGEALLTCVLCGETETEEIPAGHTFGTTWYSNDDYHWHKATCEHTSEKSEYEPHIWSTEVYIEPTHIKNGQTKNTCTVCGKVLYKNNIPPVAHVEGENHTCIECGNLVPYFDESRGGWIYYDCDFDNTLDDPDGEDDLKSDVCGWRFLVAAPADLRVVGGVPVVDSTVDGYSSAPETYVFGYNSTSANPPFITKNDALGAGADNTALFVSAMGEAAYLKNETGAGQTAEYAARLCDILVYGDFEDWFLPSSMEMSKLYANRSTVGGFPESAYWSSTEFTEVNVMRCSGSVGYPYKSSLCRIRPVRKTL